MTPLLLVTGFLGSGKTSLLRRLLPRLSAAGLQSHVVLNDYVNAALDGVTLREACDDVRLVNGACACCDGEAALLAELEQCRLGDRDVLLLEVNGTTDPLPLVELLLLATESRRYRPLRQLTVVNVSRWQERGEQNELERMQARGATHIVFTWEDTVTAEVRQAVRRAVAEFNPTARVVTAEQLTDELVRTCASGTVDVELAPATGIAARMWSAVLARPPRSHNHDLAHRFGARQLEVPRGISRARLTGWLDALPPGILRAKGLVELAEEPGRYHYFNRVGDCLTLSGFPFDPPDNRTLALLVGVADIVHTIPPLNLDPTS